jgi:hypothetical protein
MLKGSSLSKVALLALGAVVTVASAAATIALDPFGLLDTAPREETYRAQILTPIPDRTPASEPHDRFAYLAPGLDLIIPPAPTEALPPLRLLPEIETASLWSTETRAERLTPVEPPRLSAWQTRSLPRTIPTPFSKIRDPRLSKRLAEISPGALRRLTSRFETAKVAWPPTEIAMIALKDERMVELYARPDGGTWKFVHRYPVTAASGRLGPKLRQGDKQVPEGVYRISLLNPASRYHVSLRVNYPNAFDKQMAAQDGRHDLGGDIMIHGKAVSVGCIAVGDEAAEELFVLAAHTGLPNIKLVIAPTDFRRRHAPLYDPSQPVWLPKLYAEVQTAMADFQAPPRPTVGLLSSFFGN